MTRRGKGAPRSHAARPLKHFSLHAASCRERCSLEVPLFTPADRVLADPEVVVAFLHAEVVTQLCADDPALAIGPARTYGRRKKLLSSR